MTFELKFFEEDAVADGVTLTDSEKRLIAGAETGVESQANKIQTVTSLYIVERYKQLTDRLIESNERLVVS